MAAVYVNGIKTSCIAIGGGGESTGTSKPLFKNGQFYNQDIIGIHITDDCTIENGKLKFAGNHSGITVDYLNLPQGTGGYDIHFKITAGADGIGVQCGTLRGVTDNLYDVIHSGTNRITYNNGNIAANATWWERLFPSATIANGVFYGSTDYQDEDRVWYIEEIWCDILDASYAVNT